jgi:hypothetical protein
MGVYRSLIARLSLTVVIFPLAHSEAATFTRDTSAEEFCAKIESHLVQHQFEVLDGLEIELRDPNIRLIGGNSQLYEFYGALGAFAGTGLFSCNSRLSLDTKRDLLEKWIAAKPKSIASHIALGQFWWNVGYGQRGTDYADTVGFFDWMSSYGSMYRAKSAVSGVELRADPHGRYLLMEIAQNELYLFGNQRKDLDDLYRVAVEAYPSYFHYYSQRAQILQVRWFGQPGELEAYELSLASAPGGDAGLVAYSFIAYKLMQNTERSILLQTNGLSWPLIQSGYATRERLYGMRNRDWNALFNLSLAGVDRDAAKAALAHVGENWDPVVWLERKYFDEAVEWTNGR